MDRELEQIHRLLDGELSSEEERDLLRKMEADPRLQEEFDGLLSVVDILKSSERMPVDKDFSAGVMNQLPARRKPWNKKIGHFLFGERVFRWNVATFAAVSAALVLIIVTGVSYRNTGRSPLITAAVQTAAVPPDAGMKTVTLTFRAPEAKTVSLAGDFNKWSVEKGAMKKKSDGTWAIEIPLTPGVYHYMFVINGEAWVPDPRAESYRDDGFGNKNAILRVNSI